MSRRAKKASKSTKYRWDVGVLLFGGGLTLIATEAFAPLFFPGILSVYVGIFLLGLHLYKDDDIFFSWPRVRKLMCFVLTSAAVIYWTVPAPLELTAYANLGNYPPEIKVNGIPWRSDIYVDLRIDITNPTDRDCRDLDLDLAPEMMTVFAAAQMTDIPSLSFIPEGRPRLGGLWATGQAPDGKAITLPLEGAPIDMNKPIGSRLLCDKLPRHSTMRIILAVVALNYVSGTAFPVQMTLPKHLPKGVLITGTYRATGRERDVSINKTPVVI